MAVERDVTNEKRREYIEDKDGRQDSLLDEQLTEQIG